VARPLGEQRPTYLRYRLKNRDLGRFPVAITTE
jgi:hypothetical protein